MADERCRPLLPEHARLPMTVVCLVFATSVVLLVWRLGAFEHLSMVMFSTPDSRIYRALSDYLVGRTANVNPALVAFRFFRSRKIPG
jgi:hypothetical protein